VNSPRWPVRLLFWYYRRPLVGYGLLFLVVAYVGSVPARGEAATFNALVLPWAIMVLVLLNLPFLGVVARRLVLSEAERINHALEHGTIHFLVTNYGPSRGIGGRALRHGFRLSGVGNPDDIRRAFDDLLSLSPEERWRIVVAKNCGSMMVIAQGIGVFTLLLAVVLFVFIPLSRVAVTAILVTQLIIFVALRRPLGRLVQRRRLLSLSFREARIRHIHKAHVAHAFERAPVYVVETIVR
jgi:hypothetical protein